MHMMSLLDLIPAVDNLICSKNECTVYTTHELNYELTLGYSHFTVLMHGRYLELVRPTVLLGLENPVKQPSQPFTISSLRLPRTGS